jgi:histidinol-phosphate phosphatase family protein
MSFNKINKSWTLFLDRDGVINKKRENDYVKSWEEFEFLEGSIDAIAKFSKIFGKIFIVTNQRGVGKGIMTNFELEVIHSNMLNRLTENFAFVDKIYSCTCISDDAHCRKPNVGMALMAKSDYPSIDFNKSVMVGDSLSDMIFGEKLGMKRVFIKDDSNLTVESYLLNEINIFNSLIEFSFKI